MFGLFFNILSCNIDTILLLANVLLLFLFVLTSQSQLHNFLSTNIILLFVSEVVVILLMFCV